MIAAPATIPVRPTHRGIRQATLEDVPQILEMGHRFIETTVYRDRIDGDPARMASFVEHLVSGGFSLGSGIWVSQDAADTLTGMIGMFLYVHPIAGELTACETFWWVEPAHRRSPSGHRLLKTAEQWAMDAGATSIQMIAPTPDVDALYARRGYYKVETTWARGL